LEISLLYPTLCIPGVSKGSGREEGKEGRERGGKNLKGKKVGEE
jgi:hypothetical protein